MTFDLDHYLAHINEPLPGEFVEKIGLDIGGTDGDPRHPYTWASLSDRERRRALSCFPAQRIDAVTLPDTPSEPPQTTALAQAAQDLADILYRVDREWTYLIEHIDDQDLQDAVRRALEDGFPLGKALEDASAEAAEWAERLAVLAGHMPSVLSLVAVELADDVDALVADAKKNRPGEDVDEVYRVWQNGGLGGVVGRIGGIFTPTVLSTLAALLQQIHHSDDGRVREAAIEFCRALRAARQASRD